MSTLSDDSREIDFAALSRSIKTAPSEISGNIVVLDPISVSSSRLNVLFYYRGDSIFGINASQSESDELLLETKTVSDVSLNLISTVFSYYESDLGVLKANWNISQIIGLRRELQKLKSIIDFSRFSTAMTRKELIEAIRSDGGIVDGTVVHRLRLLVTITNEDTAISDIHLMFQFDVPLAE